MLQKLFGFDPSTMTLRKEVIGGITTFLTMAYILAVNPSILSATGMDAGAVFTTTCISAVVATLVMAIYDWPSSSPRRQATYHWLKTANSS